MVKYYKYVIGLLFHVIIFLVNSNSQNISRHDKNTTYVENFQPQRFCNQSTSCSIASTNLPQYGDLRSKNCMCDKQCSQYGDCCKNSGISNSKSNFTCISTSQADHFYMKTSCPSTWQGSLDIKLSCENAKVVNHKSDIPLVIPVTSENNITYRNLFCAQCNEDDNFDVWKVGVWVASNSSLNDSSTDKLTLLTDYINVISISGIIPPDLVNKVRYCLPNVIDSCPPSWNGRKQCPEYTFYVHHGNRTFKNIECLQCNERNLTLTNDVCIQPKIKTRHKDFLLKTDSFESLLQEIDFCSNISQQNPNFQQFCQADSEVAESYQCSSPDICEIQQIFDTSMNDDITLIRNDTIFLKSLHLNLTNDEYRQWIQLNKSHIFVCGINVTKNGLLNDISSWLSDILIKLSIICLILHLVVVQQLPKLRNIPGKSLAAYSFSLLVAFLCLDLDPKWGLCKYTAVILHYSLLSCFTWMLLMSYNCWQATYWATKLRKISDKKSRKFLCYTLISLLIPLLVVGIGVYLEKAPISKVPCTWKPGYGTGGECFIGRTQSFLALFIIPSSVLFVVNNLFFAYTAYLIYFNQRKNTITQQERINFKLYIRLALIMGSTWTFGSIYTFTEWGVIQILFIVLNMSQGIFIFIAFTLQKRNLKMLRSKYEKHDTIAGLFTWCLGEKVASNETTTESLRLK